MLSYYHVIFWRNPDYFFPFSYLKTLSRFLGHHIIKCHSNTQTKCHDCSQIINQHLFKAWKSFSHSLKTPFESHVSHHRSVSSLSGHKVHLSTTSYYILHFTRNVLLNPFILQSSCQSSCFLLGIEPQLMQLSGEF